MGVTALLADDDLHLIVVHFHPRCLSPHAARVNAGRRRRSLPLTLEEKAPKMIRRVSDLPCRLFPIAEIDVRIPF